MKKVTSPEDAQALLNELAEEIETLGQDGTFNLVEQQETGVFIKYPKCFSEEMKEVLRTEAVGFLLDNLKKQAALLHLMADPAEMLKAMLGGALGENLEQLGKDIEQELEDEKDSPNETDPSMN